MRKTIPRKMRAEMRRDLMQNVDPSVPKEMAEEFVDYAIDHMDAFAQVEIRRMKREPMYRAQRRRARWRAFVALALGSLAGAMLAHLLGDTLGWPGVILVAAICLPFGAFIAHTYPIHPRPKVPPSAEGDPDAPCGDSDDPPSER